MGLKRSLVGLVRCLGDTEKSTGRDEKASCQES